MSCHDNVFYYGHNNDVAVAVIVAVADKQLRVLSTG